MGIHYKPANIHWNYFLAIESDFEKISRYIEFTKANNKTFSIELARIIMASAQEIDGIMKKLCPLISLESNPQNINEYKAIIKADLPKFMNEDVKIPRFGMKSKPWSNWKRNIQDNNPDWWKANNGIKHDRIQEFEKANLKNAYNAVGALLITTFYYYKLKLQDQNNQAINWQDLTSLLKPKNSLFMLKDEYYHEPGIWSAVEW